VVKLKTELPVQKQQYFASASSFASLHFTVNADRGI